MEQSIATYFATLVGVGTLGSIITQGLKKYLKPNREWTLVFSWGTTLVLAAIGDIRDLGIFAGVQWYTTIAYGVLAGMFSNSIFDAVTTTKIGEFFTKK